MITAPKVSSIQSYYINYIKLVNADVLNVLENQLRKASNFFKELPEGKENFAYAPKKWTVKEVFGHMIDTERIMAYRALAFARGEKANLPGFDENVYVKNSGFALRSIGSLLEEFTQLRMSNIALFSSFSEEQLNRKGIANNNEVDARLIIYVIAGHFTHHMTVLHERYLSA